MLSCKPAFSMNRDSYSFPTLGAEFFFFFFSYLIALVRTCSEMLSRNGKK